MPSLEGIVKETLRDLDGLLASTLLGVASLIPGPAGVSVAAAAAATVSRGKDV